MTARFEHSIFHFRRDPRIKRNSVLWTQTLVKKKTPRPLGVFPFCAMGFSHRVKRGGLQCAVAVINVARSPLVRSAVSARLPDAARWAGSR